MGLCFGDFTFGWFIYFITVFLFGLWYIRQFAIILWTWKDIKFLLLLYEFFSSNLYKGISEKNRFYESTESFRGQIR